LSHWEENVNYKISDLSFMDSKKTNEITRNSKAEGKVTGPERSEVRLKINWEAFVFAKLINQGNIFRLKQFGYLITFCQSKILENINQLNRVPMEVQKREQGKEIVIRCKERKKPTT